MLQNGDATADTVAAVASARARAMDITTDDCEKLAAMRRPRAEQAGATATNAFQAGVRKLIHPMNVKDGRGKHLVAHRLVALAAAAVGRMLHTHGTVATEQVSPRRVCH
jgi:hypothetical protein